MTREELIAKIEKASPDNDKEFQEIVVAFKDSLSLSDLDLARMFTINRPTATRWRTGANSPHPKIRPALYRDMIEKLKAT